MKATWYLGLVGQHIATIFAATEKEKPMGKTLTVILILLAAVIALGVALQWNMWLAITAYWICVMVRYIWEASDG